MDTVGLLGQILDKARRDGTTERVERYMAELAKKVGLTDADIEAVEAYAAKVGGGAVVYYP